jgi:hypothetical protein
MFATTQVGTASTSSTAENLLRKGLVYFELPSPQPVLRHAFTCRAKSVGTVLEKFLAMLRPSFQNLLNIRNLG